MARWNLVGKVALVTGAGRRVGQAIALELGAAGCRVIVHHHASRDGAADTVRRIEAAGGTAWAIQADLTDPGQSERLFTEVDRVAGGVDVTVLSAAIIERTPFLEASDAQLEQLLAVNLIAPARVARAAARRMNQRGGGVLVSVLDIGAMQAWRNYSHYCATKAAFAMLTRCLSLELAPSIRVNAVAPGTVVFRDEETPEDRARIVRNIPLGRVGGADDVGRAVRFLCEGSDFLTGVVLPVDGGRAVRGGAEP